MDRSQSHSNPKPGLPRRSFLRTAAVAAASTRLAAQSGTIMAYVGAYTDRGKGIHIFTLDQNDGALRPFKILTGLPSPSSLYIHPNRRYLYAGNEISNFMGNRDGSVTAVAIDPATGDLKILNAISSGGRGPAHVSVDPTGKYVFTANYGAGTVGVLSINDDGSLGKVTDTKTISGPLGTQPATDAPPGSFAISGHDAPHVHMALMDPLGRFLLASDLGTDRVYIFRLDPATGTLTPNTPEFVQATNGAGPRHFAFHPNGRFLFVLNEEASTMNVMKWDPGSGEATIQQTISTLPSGYEGTNYSSEIVATPDGRFVYCGNRLHDTVAIFSVDPSNGSAKLVDLVWTRGSYPRNFAIDPTGNYMYVLHSRSDNITTFRVNRNTGGLSFTGKFTGVGNPSEIRFLRL
ncbi:MAG: lactonase family protein [Bryobacteraceae bacterium]